MSFSIVYNDHKLSKMLSVDAIVSADLISGAYVASYPHTHKSAWELVLCLTGSARVVQAGKWQTLQKQEAVFIRPGTPHDVEMPAAGDKAFVVSFTCSGIYNLIPLENKLLRISDSELLVVDRLMRELEGAFVPDVAGLATGLKLYTFRPSERSPLGAEQVITCWLEILIIMFLRKITMRDDAIAIQSEYKNLISDYMIEQVTNYIGTHMNEKLTVSEIASHFHYSRSRLSALYKEATGKGINEMITEMRITLAKYRMNDCGDSVATASERCGFSTPQYFSRVFTEKCGMTPSEYKRRCRTDEKENSTAEQEE